MCGTPERVSCYNTIGSYYCLCEEWFHENFNVEGYPLENFQNPTKPGYRVQANWQKDDDLFTVEIAHGYEYLEETKKKFTVDDDYHCSLTRCPDGKWGRGLDCFELPHEAAYCADEACSSFKCRIGWFRDGYTCEDLGLVTIIFKEKYFSRSRLSEIREKYI